MSEIELNEKNFEENITSNKLVIVDFWAPWCAPCRMLAPNLDEAVNELDGGVLAKVNIDENERLAIKYNIEVIPTLLVFREGKLINRASGYMGKEQIKNLCK